MDYADFIAQLKRHEGYREFVYLDSEGIPTGGWGHAFLEGSRLPEEVSEILLHYDMRSVENDYSSLEIPFDFAGTPREFVIKNMLYNLGKKRLLKFVKMWVAIKAGDYEAAADEMLDSKWARQVKGRATELAQMMRTNEFNNLS